MKKIVPILMMTLFIGGIISSANAALMLVPVDLKQATLLTDSPGSFLGCYLSISSEVDYIIEPTAPITIELLDDLGDGLDWIYVYNTGPLQVPDNPLVTITLTDLEVFVDTNAYYEMGLWDDAAVEQLDSLGITVPEPATVLLLGLGGLVARKRKRD